MTGLFIAGILITTPALQGCGTGGPPGGLLGVWRASFVDPLFGPGVIELILMQNGQFQQQTQYQAGALITLFGTFRVLPNEAILRLDIARGEPRQTCGPLGCTDIIYPAGETYSYSVIDPSSLSLQNVNCVPGGGGVCVFNYVRVLF